jgi:hypothetical protein
MEIPAFAALTLTSDASGSDVALVLAFFRGATGFERVTMDFVLILALPFVVALPSYITGALTVRLGRP